MTSARAGAGVQAGGAQRGEEDDHCGRARRQFRLGIVGRQKRRGSAYGIRTRDLHLERVAS